MKNLLLLLLTFCAFGFAGCDMEEANEHEEEAIDMDALRAEIQGMEDAYATAQMAKDADAVVVYYSDDANSLGPDEPTSVGKAAILAMTRKDMESDTSGRKVRFEIVDLYADGNLAVEVGRSISTAPDGTETTGKYISIFEKRDGKWICIRDIYNDDAPDSDEE